MTNGEKIINDFPYIEIKDQNKVFTTIQIDATGIGIPIIVYTEWWNKWWNAEYKEPTTKNDLALIHTEGLDEGIRCAMCTNSIKGDRGCDGSCVVNNAMYKEVMDVIENHITDTDKMIEPTTKNDLGVDCISREAVERIINKWLSHSDYELKDHIYSMTEKIHNLPSITPQLSSELEKNSKKLEKDFGELDCIDRAELLKAMDTWDKFGNDPNEGLIPLRTPALQDRYVPYVKYDDMVNCVKGMSSVTPIRPKGHWIDTNNLDVKYKAIYMCSNCRSCYTEMKPINMNFCPNCGTDMREVEK